MFIAKVLLLFAILALGNSLNLDDASGNVIPKEGRLGGNIFTDAYNKLFSKGYLKVPTKPDDEKEEEPPGLCPEGGQFMEGKCIELIEERETWDDAQDACEDRYDNDDSRLYEPNFDNPLLFKYWFKFYPDIFNGEDEYFWIGARAISPRPGPVIDVQFDSDFSAGNNDYITDNPFVVSEIDDGTINRNPFFPGPPADECIEVFTGEGSVDLNSRGCNILRRSYVCEYPAQETDYVQHLW